MSDSISNRVEAAYDRWNDLTLGQRHSDRGMVIHQKVVEASFQLAELAKLHRVLSTTVAELERLLTDIENHAKGHE